ncbi:YcxB family protein [Streptomyces sp. NPDC054887]
MNDQGRDTVQAAGSVELTYRPTRGDIAAGIRVRDRVRRLDALRWALVALAAGLGLLLTVRPAGAGAMNVLVFGPVALFVWSVPRLQARQVLRTLAWQGEYRTTVTDAGVSAASAYVTATMRWSFFRGYRETRDHVVLLAADPGAAGVEVLPKRGLGDPAGAERLLAVLDRNLRRL